MASTPSLAQLLRVGSSSGTARSSSTLPVGESSSKVERAREQRAQMIARYGTTNVQSAIVASVLRPVGEVECTIVRTLTLGSGELPDEDVARRWDEAFGRLGVSNETTVPVGAFLAMASASCMAMDDLGRILGIVLRTCQTVQAAHGQARNEIDHRKEAVDLSKQTERINRDLRAKTSGGGRGGKGSIPFAPRPQQSATASLFSPVAAAASAAVPQQQESAASPVEFVNTGPVLTGHEHCEIMQQVEPHRPLAQRLEEQCEQQQPPQQPPVQTGFPPQPLPRRGGNRPQPAMSVPVWQAQVAQVQHPLMGGTNPVRPSVVDVDED